MAPSWSIAHPTAAPRQSDLAHLLWCLHSSLHPTQSGFLKIVPYNDFSCSYFIEAPSTFTLWTLRAIEALISPCLKLSSIKTEQAFAATVISLSILSISRSQRLVPGHPWVWQHEKEVLRSRSSSCPRRGVRAGTAVWGGSLSYLSNMQLQSEKGTLNVAPHPLMLC